LTVLVLLAVPAVAFAQNTNIQWNRWDAQITAQANNQMQVVETQEVAVNSGTVSQGTRYWTTPVNLQQVYVITGNNQNPQPLTQSNSGQPGTYTLTNNGGNPTLTYVLPAPQAAGSTFLVQLSYTAQSPTTGMVDWRVIPADHPFPVQSSTITLHFPNGQAPDPGLVTVNGTNAHVTVNGNDLVIRSQAPIPAGQPLAIQVPFGAGVGAANNSGNNNNNPNLGGNNQVPVNPATDTGTAINLPGGGTLLLILCVIGFLLLVGGGSILRGILGGLLGGALGGNRQQPGGGIFGGGQQPGGLGGPFQGGDGGVNRGFRQSNNQDRNIGNVGNDKDSGGGASFK